MKIITTWVINNPRHDDIEFLQSFGKKLYINVHRQEMHEMAFHGKTFTVGGLMGRIDITSYCGKVDTLMVLRFGDRIIQTGEQCDMDLW